MGLPMRLNFPYNGLVADHYTTCGAQLVGKFLTFNPSEFIENWKLDLLFFPEYHKHYWRPEIFFRLFTCIRKKNLEYDF